jgi:hypothetical protein
VASHGILEGTADGNVAPWNERMPRPPKLLEEESLIEGGEETVEERYVNFVAADELDQADRVCAPEWLAPELVDADLTLTEDTHDSRTWAGVIDGDTYARFAEAWGLENKPSELNLSGPSEHGDLASDSHAFDGLEWESAGSSPIVWMKYTVSDPVKTEPQPIEEEEALVSQELSHPVPDTRCDLA